MEDIKTIVTDDNENINIIEVDDNKDIFPIALSDLLKGKDGSIEYIKYVDLSTNMMNPTKLEDYIDKSGTYVAKNMGVLGLMNAPITVIAEGQFFEVTNFKDIAKLMGQEIPDEENVIIVTLPSLDTNKWVLKKQGNNDWEQATLIDSLNYSNYIKIDTSQFIKASQVNNNYGLRFINNYLAIQAASQSDINIGTNVYKPITPSTISYAVQNKGATYFADKTEFETLKSDTESLISEIETILDSVVNINE